MNNFHDLENACAKAFAALGDCYHLWTSERCEILFRTNQDFRDAMNIIGICARLSPNTKVLTFQIMSNHLHFTCAGQHDDIIAFFELTQKHLERHFRKSGRSIDWTGFKGSTRQLTTLDDVRNVIAYTNRNGYVASDRHSPFTYPWGANRYYFSPDSVMLAKLRSRPMTQRERGRSINSRIADQLEGVMVYEGCASPISFCHIDLGEQLFRSAAHYFHKIGRSVESQRKIAAEIQESIFYTDDELFSAISNVARQDYNLRAIDDASASEKLALAKCMRYEYNASAKQISRFLKIRPETLASIGIS